MNQLCRLVLASIVHSSSPIATQSHAQSGHGSGHAKGKASLEGDYSQKMRVTVGEGPTNEAMKQGKRPPVSGDPKGIEPARGGQNGAPLPKSKL